MELRPLRRAVPGEFGRDVGRGENRRGGNWLPFLHAYRTMCLAPQPDFRRMLIEVRSLRLAA